MRTFTSLITACARAGRLDKALELRARMERAGIAANLYTYNSLLAACASIGNLDLALEVRCRRLRVVSVPAHGCADYGVVRPAAAAGAEGDSIA